MIGPVCPSMAYGRDQLPPLRRKDIKKGILVLFVTSALVTREPRTRSAVATAVLISWRIFSAKT
jgi:hypothetical protein